MLKVIKAAKIRNRYNHVPHLTHDTTWESEKNTTIKNHKHVILRRGYDFIYGCNHSHTCENALERERERERERGREREREIVVFDNLVLIYII